MTSSAIQAAMKALSEKYASQVKLNDIASITRMGGKYTDTGMEEASKNAQLNAMDRIRGKNMIGIGGSIVNGVMV